MSSHTVRKRTHSSAQSGGSSTSISAPSLIPLCRSSVPGWSSLDDSSFNIHALTGGMSNILYTCTLKSGTNSGDNTSHTEKPKRRRTEPEPDAEQSEKAAKPAHDDSSSSSSSSSSPSRVVIRIYGAAADSYFSREYEIYITRELAKRGIGPTIYHEFKGGRIEAFLEGATLHCHDLHDPIVSITIAQRVAQFHAQQISIPSDVSPVPLENGTPTPILLHNLQSWYKLACDSKMKDELQQTRFDALDITSETFQHELRWLREYLHSLSSPIVFCHQDLQEGNILWSPHPSHGAPSPKDIPDTFYAEKHAKHPHHVNEKTECHIIDFEYAAYNYRGFDLGNHFCEHYIDYRVPYSYHDWYESGGRFPGFAIHHRWFPSKLHMKRWLEAYAAEFRRLVPSSTINTDVEVLYRESMAFMLASHMQWALWGIIQAGTSAISFGYLDYAEQRLSEYSRLKRWIIDPDIHVHQTMMSYADTVMLSIQQQRRQAAQQRKQRATTRLVWLTLGLTLVSGLFWTRKRWA